jgi:hypothetical protein
MVLAPELGMMVRGRPIVLKHGDWLLPIYQETGDDTEVVGADRTSLFLRYAVPQKTCMALSIKRRRFGFSWTGQLIDRLCLQGWLECSRISRCKQPIGVRTARSVAADVLPV